MGSSFSYIRSTSSISVASTSFTAGPAAEGGLVFDGIDFNHRLSVPPRIVKYTNTVGVRVKQLETAEPLSRLYVHHTPGIVGTVRFAKRNTAFPQTIGRDARPRRFERDVIPGIREGGLFSPCCYFDATKRVLTFVASWDNPLLI